jgi:hypothetical protein
MTKSGKTGSYKSSFLQNLHTEFCREWTNLHFHPSSSLAFVVCILDGSHSDWNEMASLYFFGGDVTGVQT